MRNRMSQIAAAAFLLIAAALPLLCPNLAFAQGAAHWFGPATGGHLVMTVPSGGAGALMDAGGV